MGRCIAVDSGKSADHAQAENVPRRHCVLMDEKAMLSRDRAITAESIRRVQRGGEGKEGQMFNI